jgi:hypothetical protein
MIKTFSAMVFFMGTDDGLYSPFKMMPNPGYPHRNDPRISTKTFYSRMFTPAMKLIPAMGYT